ncbi:hypothetical protein ILUMI_12382 [Ignelater luminosus]|uniref:Uncharacterized protein n=1 Tax=Ignelater luminosus TaxID=2038154 RepID=A0A8K0CU91_IGNLU|nr:hypothetical protein ILUMI_12382 [Ignelater luminosus]
MARNTQKMALSSGQALNSWRVRRISRPAIKIDIWNVRSINDQEPVLRNGSKRIVGRNKFKAKEQHLRTKEKREAKKRWMTQEILDLMEDRTERPQREYFPETEGPKITRSEVEYAIKTAKGGKALGPDEISEKFLKVIEENWYVLSAKGIKSDFDKVKAILSVLRRSPRQLLKNNNDFYWRDVQQKSFIKLQEEYVPGKSFYVINKLSCSPLKKIENSEFIGVNDVVEYVSVFEKNDQTS